MSATISVEGDAVEITIKTTLTGNMLECEEQLQDALNKGGLAATEYLLQRHDTDGTVIIQAGERWYSKGAQLKKYETPYGTARIHRHVYQRHQGGATLCPMEQSARILQTSTPRYAKILTGKYARMSARIACDDLYESNRRKTVPSHFLRTAEFVGAIVEAKESHWEYELPQLERPVATVALGLDGACMLMCEDGWREAMTGTLALYDAEGERMHTLYVGAIPEYGKETFLARMSKEIEQIKRQFPDARYIGIADGARVNWDFLKPHVSLEILDFYHATHYVSTASPAIYPRNQEMAQAWSADRCHALKHDQGAIDELIDEIIDGEAKHTLKKKDKERVATSITYLENHRHQMQYAQYREMNLPIGSGVTEAACKILIKQRLCNASMRWKSKGAAVVISLRALLLSGNRWDQFWDKIGFSGVPAVA